VVLRQFVVDVVLAQPVVDMSLCGRERVLAFEIAARDEHHSGRSADGFEERLTALVAPATAEVRAFGETPSVGVPEPRTPAVGKSGGQEFRGGECRPLTVYHNAFRADEGDVGAWRAHELLAVEAMAEKSLHRNAAFYLEGIRAAGT
jgi:hypothetical protein